MTGNSLNARTLQRTCLLIVLLTVWWLYVPAVGFGLWWDDPQWFGRIHNVPLLDLIRPNPTYQFFRPGIFLYFAPFVRDNGTVNAPLLHLVQIGWHMLSTALLYRLGKALLRDRWAGLMVAVLFGLYPFAQQAVAWAQAQQAVGLFWQNLAWVWFWFGRKHSSSPLLIASLISYTIALTLQESALPLALVPLGLEWLLARQQQRPIAWRPVIGYFVLALVYGLIWVSVPRQSGVTEFALRPDVLAYLSQGLTFPLLIWDTLIARTLLSRAIQVGLLALLLATVAHRQHRRLAVATVATVAAGWATLGIAPAAFGLNASYVTIAPRVLYFAAPGVALALVALLWNRRTPKRSVALLGAITLSSVLVLQSLQTMTAQGMRSMGDLSNVLAAESADGKSRVLFVNFPDRYSDRAPLLPLGEWGWPLAPIVEPLSAYALRDSGAAIDTFSVAMPWIDQAERDASGYHVDMRGVIHQPAELATMANQYDAVYVARYAQGDRWFLQKAGAFDAGEFDGDPLAVFGNGVELLEQEVATEDDVLRVMSVWRLSAEPGPHDTFFAHLGTPGQPPLAQQDGDAWATALPLTAWPLNQPVLDVREFDLDGGFSAENLTLSVGLYNWVSGERLLSIDASGSPLENGAWAVSPVHDRTPDE